MCPWCIGAVTGVVSGYAIAKLSGADYDWKDAAADAVLGAAGAGIVSKLDKLNDLRKAAGAADDVAGAVRGLSKAERTLATHVKKLEAYKRNPGAFDTKDFLKNAPTPEIRERIIRGRIKHLENEIRAIQKAIDEGN